MRITHNAAIFCLVMLTSCQPTADEVKPMPQAHQSLVFDYSMLGIWPERYQAYEISNALEEVGIRSKMSGSKPCILNVETSKLERAQRVVLSDPSWSGSMIR